jgi:hypothetical protein
MPAKLAQHLTIAADSVIIKVSLQLLFKLGEQCRGSKFTALLLDPGFNRGQSSVKLLLSCPHRDQRFANSTQTPAVLEAKKGKAVVILRLEAGKLDNLRFLNGQLQQKLSQALTEDSRESPLVFAILEAADKSSSPREPPPQALTEPDVNVSAHPAPIVQPL